MTATPTVALTDFPVLITLPVLWGDQDAFGHVNNTVYLRWFESARVAYFDRVGLSETMEREKIGPILASVTCHYRRQVKYPETVHVGSRIVRIGRTSLTMDYQLVVESNRAVAADGTSTVVVFDYKDNRPHPVPDILRRAIEGIEGRSF